MTFIDLTTDITFDDEKASYLYLHQRTAIIVSAQLVLSQLLIIGSLIMINESMSVVVVPRQLDLIKKGQARNRWPLHKYN